MRIRIVLGAVVLGIGLLPTPSRADIIFTLGNNPQQPGEENVLLNKGTSGSTVSGTTNQSGTVVDFTSATQTLSEPANGQARIEAVDASGNQVALSDISAITLASGAPYFDLIFNSHIGGTIGTAGGTETVTVLDNLGVTHPFSFSLGNGENFLTIVATNGQSIASTAISYPTGFTDLQQVRISLSASVIPEPATYTMLATGLGILAVARARMLRRKRQA